jgi:hypothetical protein
MAAHCFICWEATYNKTMSSVYSFYCIYTHTESFVFSKWKVHGSNKSPEVISGGYEENQEYVMTKKEW